MTNPAYNFWRARLAGDTSPATNEDPQCGFFRVRERKGGPFVPLAIFEDGSRIIGWLGPNPTGRVLVDEELNTRWAWCNTHAVTEVVYRAVAERGEGWPDQDASVAAMGHNSNAVSDAEQIKSQIESAAVGAKDYAEIKNADQFARSQDLRSRLLELSRTADNRRKELKKPHQDAADGVDADWMPAVKAAKAAADKINAAQNTYSTRLLREREAAEAKIATEKAALEAKGVRLPDLAPPPPLPSKVRGASGRGANVGTRTVVKSVTDWPALFAFFQSDEGIQSALLKLANKAVEGGQPVPGVETEVVGRVK